MRRTVALLLAVPTALAFAAHVPSAGDHGPGATGGGATVAAPDPVPASTRPEPSPRGARPSPPAAEAEDPGRHASGGPVRIDGGGTPGEESPATRGPALGPAPDGDRTAEGFVVAAVPPLGGVAGAGPRWRYTIEVEPATGLDVEEVATVVRSSLGDERSWARTRTLEQVDDPRSARIRLLVATPDTVDRLCARAGLRTVGIFSCWNGAFAALNSWRWDVGSSGFTDLTEYRTYLINHEFGHGLGYGHVGCPSPGAVAPVMMQQSKGLDGCLANGWPFP